MQAWVDSWLDRNGYNELFKSKLRHVNSSLWIRSRLSALIAMLRGNIRLRVLCCHNQRFGRAELYAHSVIIDRRLFKGKLLKKRLEGE
jgi:hypothetical protein